MISSDVMQKIESEFRNMNQFQIYLVPLLAFERMWTPFLEGLRPQYKSKLEYCARNCLDIMWDYVIEKKTLQKDIYQKQHIHFNCNIITAIFLGLHISLSTKHLSSINKR